MNKIMIIMLLIFVLFVSGCEFDGRQICVLSGKVTTKTITTPDNKTIIENSFNNVNLGFGDDCKTKGEEEEQGIIDMS